KKSQLIANVRREFHKRENSAAWFVSNCDPKFRMQFTTQLKTHFPLRVGGSCAKYACSLNENCLVNFLRNLIQPNDCARGSKCEYIEFARSKFFLSFESKNCTNYITEKSWLILRANLIPVVIQPAKMFYEMNLPLNSYIHA